MKLSFNNLNALEHHPLIKNFSTKSNMFLVSKHIGDHTTIINQYVTLYTQNDLLKMQNNYDAMKQRKKEHGRYYMDESLTDFYLTIPKKQDVIQAITALKDHNENTFRFLELLYSYKDNNDQITAIRNFYKTMYHNNRIYKKAYNIFELLITTNY